VIQGKGPINGVVDVGNIVSAINSGNLVETGFSVNCDHEASCFFSNPSVQKFLAGRQGAPCPNRGTFTRGGGVIGDPRNGILQLVGSIYEGANYSWGLITWTFSPIKRPLLPY